MHRWSVLLALFVAAPVATAQQPGPAVPPPLLRGADAYIDRAMREWEVPGLAIAVVQGDSVVWSRGFGVRELGRPEAVDPRTVFVAASTTKAFTVALLGMLVDSGLLRWDDPVTRWLPGLQVADPYVTRELTVRDLVSHRSGLERSDDLWYGTAHTRAEILRRLRFQQQGASFRSRYGYNNNLFIAAGEVAAAASGRSWDDLMRERLFLPLGMTRSSTRLSVMRTLDNVATPHARYDGRMQPIAHRDYDNVGAAGALNTCVLDMAQWLRLQLGNGMLGGRRLLSSAAMREMRQPVTTMPSSARQDSIFPEIHLRAYGLGWFLSDYRGRLLVYHSGSLDGMRAQVAFLPEERVGVVLMANSNQAADLLVALRLRILDAFLGGMRRDWAADLLVARRQDLAREERETRRQDSLRVRGTTPSRPLAEFAGRYVDSLHGEVTITLEDGRLVARAGTWVTGDLEHWHYDTFRVTWRDREFDPGRLTFRDGVDGKVAAVEFEDWATFGRSTEPPARR